MKEGKKVVQERREKKLRSSKVSYQKGKAGNKTAKEMKAVRERRGGLVMTNKKGKAREKTAGGEEKEVTRRKSRGDSGRCRKEDKYRGKNYT